MGFTEAYAQIRTELQALFASYTEIDNPYDIEQNPEIQLKTAYGITIGTATNATRAICGRADVIRSFDIVLCRRINATMNDSATRITAEKNLFEDQMSIIKKFEGNIANVKKARYLSDNGIEFLGNDKYNYLVLRSTFEVEYSEAL